MMGTDDQKSWLDATPSRTAFYFGLAIGVGASALVGFVILLSIMMSGGVQARTLGAAAVVPSAQVPNPAVLPDDNTPPAPVKISITDADHVKGSKGAKVTVIEYSDFQCPFCDRFEPTITQLIKDFGDKIYFTYRHFPLDAIHPNARPAAAAAECGAEQGKFYEFHDQLFAKQATLSDALYTQIATDLKLDMGKFADCIKSGRGAKKVDADYQSGLAVGVQGTPATFVNGVLISGAQPYEVLKGAVENALK